MDRRAFLRALGFGTVAAAAATSVFDIEKLLWVQGEKTIFVPSLIRFDMLSMDDMKRLVDAADRLIFDTVYRDVYAKFARTAA